jgi:hypothetical protein
MRREIYEVLIFMHLKWSSTLLAHVLVCTLQQGLWTQISFFINGEQEGKIDPVLRLVKVGGDIRKCCRRVKWLNHLKSHQEGLHCQCTTFLEDISMKSFLKLATVQIRNTSFPSNFSIAFGTATTSVFSGTTKCPLHLLSHQVSLEIILSYIEDIFCISQSGLIFLTPFHHHTHLRHSTILET